ncbi:DNA polymerase delta subunit 3 [Linum grandiflorum]
METLGILEDVETLVSDKNQVVSYKWLSRNFLVPSNDAKRLLQDFVDKHRSSLNVVYTVSGWLNENPPSYKVRLVSGLKLDEAKQDFDGSCSVEVYSVQTCIPRDPAALWNMEFIQAEELIKQPSTDNNCLRDNRLCGIVNSFVQRVVDGTPVSSSPAQTNNIGIRQPSTSLSASGNSMAPPGDENKVKQPSNMVGEVKTEKNGKIISDKSTKPSAVAEKAPSLPIKGQGDTNSSKNGGSLAKLWGNATVKPKSTSTPTANNAEAGSCASETFEDVMNDYEDGDVNVKRGSNGLSGRKRRVVFDDSDDECEDAVNLSSGDLVNGQSKKPVSTTDRIDDIVMNDEKKPDVGIGIQNVKAASSAPSKCSETKTSLAETKSSCIKPNDVKDNAASKPAPSSSKRNKVMKTWIDERGREVTEVVYEQDETEKKSLESKKAGNTSTDVTTKPANREPASKKPTPAPTHAGGKKAAGKKDPKQGNIMSFFKKV